MHRYLIVLIAMSVAYLNAADWPSFRGPNASGVVDGMKLPAKWDAAKGEGILFKVKIVENRFTAVLSV